MTTAAPPRSELARLRLRVEDRVFELTSPRLVVGRSRSCDIRLQEPTVSRHHAVLDLREDEAVITDLGSSNGTFVADALLQAPRSVRVGEAIRFGAVHAVLEAHEVVGSASAAPPTDYTVGVLEGNPAGLGHRLAAVAIDVLLLCAGSALALAPLLVTGAARRWLLLPGVADAGTELPGLTAASVALWALFAWYYLVRGWSHRGGSPGMRLLRLRLTDDRCHVPIGSRRAWLRLAAAAVVVPAMGLGFLTVPLRRDRRAVHDILAKTLVLRR